MLFLGTLRAEQSLFLRIMNQVRFFAAPRRDASVRALGMTRLPIHSANRERSNDAPGQPRLLPYFVDLRKSLPDSSNFYTRNAFTGWNGNRAFQRRRGDHHDIFSPFNLLCIPLTAVRIPVAPIDGLASCRKTLAV